MALIAALKCCTAFSVYQHVWRTRGFRRTAVEELVDAYVRLWCTTCDGRLMPLLSNKFQRKATDSFEIKCVPLGGLKKLKVRHDNKVCVWCPKGASELTSCSSRGLALHGTSTELWCELRARVTPSHVNSGSQSDMGME